MQRGPLIEILEGMIGSDKELNLQIAGECEPMEIRNVVAVEPLHSAAGLKLTTKQNYVWIDASHVAAAWQARTDL